MLEEAEKKTMNATGNMAGLGGMILKHTVESEVRNNIADRLAGKTASIVSPRSKHGMEQGLSDSVHRLVPPISMSAVDDSSNSKQDCLGSSDSIATPKKIKPDLLARRK